MMSTSPKIQPLTTKPNSGKTNNKTGIQKNDALNKTSQVSCHNQDADTNPSYGTNNLNNSFQSDWNTNTKNFNQNRTSNRYKFIRKEQSQQSANNDTQNYRSKSSLTDKYNTDNKDAYNKQDNNKRYNTKFNKRQQPIRYPDYQSNEAYNSSKSPTYENRRISNRKRNQIEYKNLNKRRTYDKFENKKKIDKKFVVEEDDKNTIKSQSQSDEVADTKTVLNNTKDIDVATVNEINIIKYESADRSEPSECSLNNDDIKNPIDDSSNPTNHKEIDTLATLSIDNTTKLNKIKLVPLNRLIREELIVETTTTSTTPIDDKTIIITTPIDDKTTTAATLIDDKTTTSATLIDEKTTTAAKSIDKNTTTATTLIDNKTTTTTQIPKPIIQNNAAQQPKPRSFKAICKPNLVQRRRTLSSTTQNKDTNEILFDKLLNMDKFNLKNIINNSNTEYDEALKLKARQRLCEEFRKKLKVLNIENTKNQLNSNPDNIVDERIDDMDLPPKLLDQICQVVNMWMSKDNNNENKNLQSDVINVDDNVTQVDSTSEIIVPTASTTTPTSLHVDMHQIKNTTLTNTTNNIDLSNSTLMQRLKVAETFKSPTKLDAKGSNSCHDNIHSTKVKKLKKRRRKKKNMMKPISTVIIISSSSSSSSSSDTESTADGTSATSSSTTTTSSTDSNASETESIKERRQLKLKVTERKLVDSFEKIVLPYLSDKSKQLYEKKYCDTIRNKLMFMSLICTSDYNSKKFTKIEVAKIQKNLKADNNKIGLDFLTLQIVNVSKKQQQNARTLNTTNNKIITTTTTTTLPPPTSTTSATTMTSNQIETIIKSKSADIAKNIDNQKADNEMEKHIKDILKHQSVNEETLMSIEGVEEKNANIAIKNNKINDIIQKKTENDINIDSISKQQTNNENIIPSIQTTSQLTTHLQSTTSLNVINFSSILNGNLILNNALLTPEQSQEAILNNLKEINNKMIEIQNRREMLDKLILQMAKEKNELEVMSLNLQNQKFILLNTITATKATTPTLTKGQQMQSQSLTTSKIDVTEQENNEAARSTSTTEIDNHKMSDRKSRISEDNVKDKNTIASTTIQYQKHDDGKLLEAKVNETKRKDNRKPTTPTTTKDHTHHNHYDSRNYKKSGSQTSNTSSTNSHDRSNTSYRNTRNSSYKRTKSNDSYKATKKTKIKDDDIKKCKYEKSNKDEITSPNKIINKKSTTEQRTSKRINKKEIENHSTTITNESHEIDNTNDIKDKIDDAEDSNIPTDHIDKRINSDNSTDDHSDIEMIADYIKTGDIISTDQSVIEICIYQNNLIVATDKGYLCKYELSTLNLIEKFSKHTEAITQFHLSKEKNILYTVSLDGYLKKTAIENFSLDVQSVYIEEPLQSIEIQWGKAYIGSRWGNIFKYDMMMMSKTKESALCSAGNSIIAIKAATEGSRRVLIISTKGNIVQMRDAKEGILLRTFHVPERLSIYSLLLDDSHLYCGTQRNEIYKFDFTTGEVLKVFTCGNGTVILKLYRNNFLFVGCYDGFIYVNDKTTGNCIGRFRGSGKVVLTLEIVDNKVITSAKENKTLSVIEIPKDLIALINNEVSFQNV